MSRVIALLTRSAECLSMPDVDLECARLARQRFLPAKASRVVALRLSENESPSPVRPSGLHTSSMFILCMYIPTRRFKLIAVFFFVFSFSLSFRSSNEELHKHVLDFDLHYPLNFFACLAHFAPALRQFLGGGNLPRAERASVSHS